MDIVTKTLNQFQKRFEELLDHSTEETQQIPDFEVNTSEQYIKGIPIALPSDHIDRTIVIFHRLAPFFNAGILMENQDGTWTTKASFQNGQVRTIPQGLESILKLPQMKTTDLFSTPAKNILGKLSWKFDSIDQQSTALLLKPSPDFAFVLISELPQLWLKSHSQSIHSALIESYSS